MYSPIRLRRYLSKPYSKKISRQRKARCASAKILLVALLYQIRAHTASNCGVKYPLKRSEQSEQNSPVPEEYGEKYYTAYPFLYRENRYYQGQRGDKHHERGGKTFRQST